MLRVTGLTLALCANAWAQVATATLTGIVTDPTHAPVPGVTIQVTNDETGVATNGAANTQGEYTIPLLPPGHYRLKAEAQGFQSYQRTGLALEIGRVFRVDVALELGQMSQVVSVSASAPLLESENASISQLIENKTIVGMPLNGRRVGDLAALLGNAILIQSGVFLPRIEVGGGRADQLMWLLDGVTAQNVLLQTPQTNFNPPVESMQEFRILSNNYSAEYGGTNSGVISFSTKSGTNQLRGALYEFFRNDKLDARNFFSDTKAPLRWNIFGFAVGGPVRKNKTFYFVSTEWQKQHVGVTRLLNLPTALQRAGDFSQTLNAAGALARIYDPGTSRPNPSNAAQTIRDQFPGNVIPPSRFDPVGVNFVKFYPLPNRPATNLAGANNFARNSVSTNDNTTVTAKVDHYLTSRDRLTGRFAFYDLPSTVAPVFSEPAADPFANHIVPHEYTMMAGENHNFSPTLINDFRFDFGPRSNTNKSLGFGQGWPGKLGLKGVSDAAFPRLTAAGFTAEGPTVQEQIGYPVHDTHILNQLSWFHGKHASKFGGETRLGRTVNLTNQTISGSLAFGVNPTALPGAGNTGSSLASLLLGLPDSGSFNAPDLLDRRSKYFAWFVQDDWKITPNLTVNLGVRWEASTPRVDANNRQNGFDPAAINPVSGTPGVITFAGVNGMSRNIYDGDYDNFAPRVGLAWKPFGGGKTVIRSGFGMFYGPPLPTTAASAGFSTTGSFASPDSGITPPFLLQNGFPTVTRVALTPGFGAVPVGQPAVFAPDFYQRLRELGYSEQWNFGIQREVGWRTLVEALYTGTAGHRLQGPDTSINQVPVALLGPGNAQARRPFPQFGNVNLAAPFWGNSSYHSLNLKFEKRFSNGLNFLGNYTVSKFIDDVSASFEVGAVAGGFQNVYNRRAEKSLSGNDIRNRVSWSSVYEIPAGKGRRWLNKGVASAALGGWSLGLIAVLQQGSPYGLTTQTNTTNAFNPGPQRVNILRNPALPASQQTLQRWFDTSAVAAPPQFTFGNAGRAVLTGPGLETVDISLLKSFRWRERFNLEVRLESFNLPNRANFGNPGQALGSPNFGVISSAGDPRTNQLGMRLEF